MHDDDDGFLSIRYLLLLLLLLLHVTNRVAYTTAAVIRYIINVKSARNSVFLPAAAAAARRVRVQRAALSTVRTDSAVSSGEF